MADLLPDVPADLWNNFSAGQFADAVGEKISSLPGDISQGVQDALAPPAAMPTPPVEPAPAPPPPPAPAPAPAPMDTAPPPPPDIPPPPPDLSAPPPDVTPAPADITAPAPDQTPTPAPAPTDTGPPPPPAPADTTPPPPSPSPPPTPSTSQGQAFDPIGAAMGAADAAGADMGQFTQALNQHLSTAGGDVVGAALGAADAAGADMGQFSNQLSTAMANAPQQAQQAVQQGAQGAQQTVQSLGIQGPTAKTPGDLIDQTRQAAINAGIDPDIFARQIQQESGFNPQAGSSAGAQGIAQFMPATAKQYGVDPWDPTSALPGAAKMMSNLLDQYGGDWSKALAAYNGGDAAVQQLNAGHPWQETQQYLNTILGGAKNVVQQKAQDVVQTGQTAVNTASDTAQAAAARTSQFAMGLSSGDAMAFCGPAAAMAFAETFGRNPTVDEAKQLAAQVGWNPDQGMAGPSSEVSLLNKLGIATHMSQGVDWSQVAGDASSGNPVIIDTPGHYFYVDGYNSDTGQFHLGTSATDLKAAQGKEWFTPSQIPGLGMGDPRAAIFADHPLSGAGVAAGAQQAVGGAQQALSNAQQTAGGLSQQAQDTMSAVLDTGSQTAQDATSGASNWLDSQKAKLSSGLTDLTGGAQGVFNQAQQGAGGDIQSLLDAAQQAGYDTTGLRNQMPDVSSKAQDLVSTAQSSGQDLSTLIQQAPDQAAQIVQQAAQGGAGNWQNLLSGAQQAGYDVSGLLGQAGQGAQQDLLSAATSPVGQQLMQAAIENAQGGPSLIPAGSLDLYRQANALKNQWIAQNNPIGNVNVLGGASTGLAQGLTDPAMLALLPLGVGAAAPVADLLGGGALGTLGTRAAEGALLGAGTTGAEGGNLQDVLTSGLTGALSGTALGGLQIGAPLVGRALAAAPGQALSGGLSLMDLLSAPELAYARTQGPEAFGAGGAAATSGADLLQRALEGLSAYPEEQIGQVRQLATAASEAGAAPASEIAGMLQQWMRENPVSSEAIQAVTDAVTGASPEDVAQITRAIPEAATPARPAAVGAGEGGAPPGGGGPPIETLTSGTTPPPPTPPTGPAATAPGGNVFSRFGQLLASVASPTQNLPSDVASVIRDYGDMVGRQSNAANVIANSDALQQALTPEGVQSVMQGLRSDAANQLVNQLQSMGKAAPRNYAPATFQSVTDEITHPLSNYAFSPDVVPALKGITNQSWIANNPLFSTIQKVQGTAKSTIFSLSNFHTLTEGLNALYSSPQTAQNYAKAFVSKNFFDGLRGGDMLGTFNNAARNGVTGLAQHLDPAGGAAADVSSQIGNAVLRHVVSGGVGGAGGAAAGYTEAKIAGRSDEEALQQALIYGTAGAALGGIPTGGGRGTVSDILQSSLWDRAVPMAKATAWDGLVKSGLDPKVAADVVNQRFGGLNYASMGRDPTVVDASKLILQAPDWTESTVRQLGSAIFGGSGAGVTRGFLARAIGGQMIATELLNYFSTGHSTLDNQPGYQFQVEHADPAGGYMHAGILPGNVQSFLNELDKQATDTSAKRSADLRNLVTGRLSTPLQLAGEVSQATAANPLNQPYGYARAGPVGLGEALSPIGVQQVAQGANVGGVNPAIATLMAALGLNPTYTNPNTPGGQAPQPSGQPIQPAKVQPASVQPAKIQPAKVQPAKVK